MIKEIKSRQSQNEELKANLDILLLDGKAKRESVLQKVKEIDSNGKKRGRPKKQDE